MSEPILPGTLYTLNDERGSCWCCLGSGEDDRGGECVACDGSGVEPGSSPCQPLCREPERADWGVA